MSESRQARRRAPGEGGLYRRKDGKWEARISLGYGPDGKRRRRRAVAATKSEAGRRLAMMRTEQEKGLEPAAEAWTVSDWLQRWCDSEAGSLRPRTLATYRSSINKHLVPALGSQRIRQLTPSLVRLYLDGRLGEGAAAQTVRNEHAILRRGLEVATRYGYLEKNVARLVTSPRVRVDERNPLGPTEVRQLLAAAREGQWEAVYVVAASTGMRRAEVLGLTWSCVDLEAGTLRVDRTLVRYDREFHLDDPKTRTSRRTIVVPEPVVTVLRRHRARQAEERLKLGKAWGNEWDLVFTEDDGRPIEARRLHDDFVSLLKRAKVRRVRFHDLRHGAASFLYAQGANMKEIQATLGHATLSITADLYTHFGDELRRGVADKMNAALFETGT